MSIGRHLGAAAFLASATGAAVAALAMLGSAAADRAQAGDAVVALFDRDVTAARVIDRLDAAGARRFSPLGRLNAWVVEASGPGLAATLRAQGARLVIGNPGSVAFALGCSPTAVAAAR